jgi:SAM-dependent methyltransferase
MEASKKRRWERQPRELPNGGSVFKRPPGRFVGPMIDELGLKGFTIGGAQISKKHSGFIVNTNNATGMDISPIAIEKAKEVGTNMKTNVNFEIRDFKTDSLSHNEYDFVFDRGFFHSFDTHLERLEIAKRISKVLKKEGLWLSLIGNSDGIKTNPGPPLRTAEQVITAIEPYFQVLSIKASHFGNDEARPAKIWVCLMRKRDL